MAHAVFGGLLIQLITKVLRKYDGSEYETRVQHNRDFYGDLEARIQEAMRIAAGGDDARTAVRDTIASVSAISGLETPH